jgi:hypothetical protein
MLLNGIPLLPKEVITMPSWGLYVPKTIWRVQPFLLISQREQMLIKRGILRVLLNGTRYLLRRDLFLLSIS